MRLNKFFFALCFSSIRLYNPIHKFIIMAQASLGELRKAKTDLAKVKVTKRAAWHLQTDEPYTDYSFISQVNAEYVIDEMQVVQQDLVSVKDELISDTTFEWVRTRVLASSTGNHRSPIFHSTSVLGTLLAHIDSEHSLSVENMKRAEAVREPYKSEHLDIIVDELSSPQSAIYKSLHDSTHQVGDAIIPIVWGNHWFIIVLCRELKEIHVFDSLESKTKIAQASNDVRADALTVILINALQSIIPDSVFLWSGPHFHTIGPQRDFFSCGLFALRCVELLSTNCDMNGNILQSGLDACLAITQSDAKQLLYRAQVKYNFLATK